MSNKKINISELDFSGIKENIKDYLQGQNEFTDYNFDGSNLSIIIDLLAYNAHHLSYHLNMATNEMFLDSSTIRNSVVSHAKTLGYIPRSPKSPMAVIDVQLNETTGIINPIIPKGTIFKTVVDDVTYNYLTNNDHTAQIENGVIIFKDIPIYEGKLIKNVYTVSTESDKYTLSSSNADIETILVTVQESETDSTSTVYKRYDDVTNLENDTCAYFIQEFENGLYQISFGDNIFGKSLDPGNIVIIEYIVTSKSLSNGASSFSIESDISGINNISIILVEPSSGGGDSESIDSIKFNAPLSYSSANRAVTTNDYYSIIKSSISNIKDIAVWGGEDNDPPIYGKVFIAVKPIEGVLSLYQKKIVTDNLKEYNIVSITPEIVDPDNIYIQINTKVNFNSKRTNLVESDLAGLVYNNIINFGETELVKFNTNFRYSSLMAVIDQTEDSIISNETDIKIRKRVDVQNGIFKYTVDYNNRIYHPYDGYKKNDGGVIASSGFHINNKDDSYYIDDDGNGNVRLYKLVSGSVRVYEEENVGAIDYHLGKIYFELYVDKQKTKNIDIVVVPENKEIFSVRNNLLEIDAENINIEVKRA